MQVIPARICCVSLIDDSISHNVVDAGCDSIRDVDRISAGIHRGCRADAVAMLLSLTLSVMSDAAVVLTVKVMAVGALMTLDVASEVSVIAKPSGKTST